MAQQVPISEEAIVAASGDAVGILSDDLAYKRLAILNVVLVGAPDAGDRVLTHGHFDHVGGLETLAAEWDVPVWAHHLERPYLDGSAAYPPSDPRVGGGLMTLLSPLYPTAPVDVGSRLHDLPEDGSVPPMPGWRWIHTPGHSPGHISLTRGTDLIAGDAFITTAQEFAYAVALQEPELHGPPKYLTIDWNAARVSVETRAVLDPSLVITGYGRPMGGPALGAALHHRLPGKRRT